MDKINIFKYLKYKFFFLNIPHTLDTQPFCWVLCGKVLRNKTSLRNGNPHDIILYPKEPLTSPTHLVSLGKESRKLNCEVQVTSARPPGKASKRQRASQSCLKVYYLRKQLNMTFLRFRCVLFYVHERFAHRNVLRTLCPWCPGWQWRVNLGLWMVTSCPEVLLVDHLPSLIKMI